MSDSVSLKLEISLWQMRHEQSRLVLRCVLCTFLSLVSFIVLYPLTLEVADLWLSCLIIFASLLMFIHEIVRCISRYVYLSKCIKDLRVSMAINYVSKS